MHEEVSVTLGDSAEPAGHAEKMAELVDNELSEVQADAAAASEEPQQETAEPVAERPADIPEKFWDAEKGQVRTEALLKSYRELEGKMRSGDKAEEAQPETAPESETTPDEAPPSADTADNAIQKADAYYAEHGELSDEMYDSLEKAGVTRNMVDTYIKGQLALVEAELSEAYARAGGKEEYAKMVQWAADNLSEPEQEAFDMQVRNPKTRGLAVDSLAAKYRAEQDTTPNLLGGDNQPTPGEVFENAAEMAAAINDPRYHTSSNYRAQVQRKIDNSSRAGINLWM